MSSDPSGDNNNAIPDNPFVLTGATMFYLYYMNLCHDKRGAVIFSIYHGATWEMINTGFRKQGAMKRIQYLYGSTF